MQDKYKNMRRSRTNYTRGEYFAAFRTSNINAQGLTMPCPK